MLFEHTLALRTALVCARAMSEMHKSTSTNAFAVSMGSLASFQSHLTSEQEAACAHRPLPGMAVDSAPPGFRSAAAANGFRLSSIANGTTCHDHPAHPLPLSAVVAVARKAMEDELSPTPGQSQSGPSPQTMALAQRYSGP